MNKKGFTLIELLAVIIILGLLIVVVIPTSIKALEKAKDASLIAFANKVKVTANRYALMHRDEVKNNMVTKDIKDLMEDTGKYEGT